jgi:type II secretory pathway component PulK
MIIFFVAAILAMGMLTRQQMDVIRTTNMLGQTQAMQYALGAETLAQQVLIKSAILTPGIDYLGQNWALLHETMSIKNGSVTLKIEDLQGKINLNSLLSLNTTLISYFNNLLKKLEIPVEALTLIKELVSLAVPDNNGVLFISDVTALHRLNSIDAEYIGKLIPYVAVLPESTPHLNINTASDTVIRATITNDKAYNVLMNLRTTKGYITSEQLSDNFHAVGLATSSSYFSVTANVIYDGHSTTLKSVLHRFITDTGKVNISVISRDLSNF